MTIDINKFRSISAFSGNTNGDGDYERQMLRKQAIKMFDVYQRYAPNSHLFYVNDDITPILGTLQDVSDLEVSADTKWLATSLEHKLNAGDILTLNTSDIYTFDTDGKPIGRKWIVVYDKDKGTANSRKVKIQPCNYAIKFPFYQEDLTPSIYLAHSQINAYQIDSKDFKQPFPSETGSMFAQIQFNSITSKLKEHDRIWLYNKGFLITGIDFTEIDFYTNKGMLKITMRPDLQSNDLDNTELGIADYYKFFSKPTVTPTPIVSPITLTTSDGNPDKLMIYGTLSVTANQDVVFAFDGDNLGCKLQSVTSNSCILKVGSKIGIVNVKAYLGSDPTVFTKLRVVINNGW